MTDQALYDYIQNQLSELRGVPDADGLEVPEGVEVDQFLRVLGEVERDLNDGRLAE
jgi:hypothetical protein